MSSRFFILFVGLAAGCTPSGQPAKTAPTQTLNNFVRPDRTWATGRIVEKVPPFGGAPFREIPLPSTPASPFFRLLYSPDGSRIAAIGPGKLTVWDVGNRHALASITIPREAGWNVFGFTADGGSVLAAVPNKPIVKSWDARTGVAGPEWVAGTATDLRTIALAPGGNRVFVLADPQAPGHPVYERGRREPLVVIRPREILPGGAFTPDTSRFVSRNEAGQLRCIELNTGRTLWEQETGRPRSVPLAAVGFSSGGNYLHTSSVAPGFPPMTFAFYAGADGAFMLRQVMQPPLAHSSDGRIALAVGSGGLTVYDFWIETKHSLTLPQEGFCQDLAVSPDGTTMACLVGSRFGQALYFAAFPTFPPPVNQRDELTPEQIEEYWTALGSANGFRRQYAVSVFAARPEQAMTIVPHRVGPVAQRDGLLVEDLVRNLADIDPMIRDRVASELVRYVERFRPMLTAARDAAGPGPTRDRLAEALMNAAAPPVEVGVVEVLERIGTPQARKVLTALAGGARGAAVTEAAAASLRRLEARKPYSEAQP